MVVVHQRARVEQVQRGAIEQSVRPGLLLEEAHGGFVAVQPGAQLDFLDEGAGPLIPVARFLGCLAELFCGGCGFRELLLRDETFHLGPFLCLLRLGSGSSFAGVRGRQGVARRPEHKKQSQHGGHPPSFFPHPAWNPATHMFLHSQCPIINGCRFSLIGSAGVARSLSYRHIQRTQWRDALAFSVSSCPGARKMETLVRFSPGACCDNLPLRYWQSMFL